MISHLHTRQARLILVYVLILLLPACARPARGNDGAAANTSAAPAPTALATPVSTATIRPTPTAVDSPVATAVAPSSPLLTATAPASPLAQAQTEREPIYTYEVVAEYPYDPAAWTQGLVFTNGVLYVGTGLNGQSSLRKTDLESGDILEIVTLPEEFFGEGVTVFDDKVYQLTWKEQKGFVYNEEDFSPLATFTYPTEGWGLTHDGDRLIMSDGTSTLYFRDPDTFEETGRIAVTSSLGQLWALNELEYVDGEIFANIWTTDWIARIDPETGAVLGWINLAGLLPAEYRLEHGADVLNGIAYDAESGRLFVTGKFWPTLFEIELIPAG